MLPSLNTSRHVGPKMQFAKMRLTTIRLMVVAMVVVSSGLVSAIAQAQTASRGGKLPAQVTITNERDLILASLEIMPKAGGTAVATLKEPLSAGSSVKLRLTKAKGCAYVVSGLFEDGSDLAPVQLDLCKDPLLRLVD
jgi:hypothetical protein